MLYCPRETGSHTRAGCHINDGGPGCHINDGGAGCHINDGGPGCHINDGGAGCHINDGGPGCHINDGGPGWCHINDGGAGDPTFIEYAHQRLQTRPQIKNHQSYLTSHYSACFINWFELLLLRSHAL
uniref:Uncharacterized protein n=1 Tax=Cyclopterus lumpus TaxID=8103 RepID=A0A8C2Z7W7_CYCLU